MFNLLNKLKDKEFNLTELSVKNKAELAFNSLIGKFYFCICSLVISSTLKDFYNWQLNTQVGTKV